MGNSSKFNITYEVILVHVHVYVCLCVHLASSVGRNDKSNT